MLYECYLNQKQVPNKVWIDPGNNLSHSYMSKKIEEMCCTSTTNLLTTAPTISTSKVTTTISYCSYEYYD